MQITDFLAPLYREGKVTPELLIIVEHIGLEAAAIIRTMLQNGNYEVTTKAHASDFLTTIDLAVNDHLRKRLMDLDPDFGWVSEESKDNAFQEITWVIDPIDGTYGLVHQNSEYAISIGLVMNGTPILGVVISPKLGFQDIPSILGHQCTVISGAKDVGVFMNGIRMENAWQGTPKVLLGWPDFHGPQNYDGFEKILMGSIAWRIANVAAGNGHISITDNANLSAWDIAAGHAILLAAGGKATNIIGEELTYTNADAKINGLIASC